MPAAIDFYFDFSSPYAYLSSFRIDELAARFGRTVTWRPYMMGAALKLSGRPISMNGSMDGTIAADYLRKDVERGARLDKRPFKWPPKFPVNGVHAGRLYYYLMTHDAEQAKPFARDIFASCFGLGLDISDAQTVIDVAAKHHITAAQAQLLLNDADIKEQLRAATDAALALGVFGSPFFIIDGESFWGNDRLWQVKRWLEWGGW